MKNRIAALAAAVMFVGTAASSATLVFSEDFSSGTAGPEISGSGTVKSVGGLAGYNSFADNFLHNNSGGAATNVSLTGLSAHTSATISFSLAFIDSWDGVNGSVAPDYFNLLLGGVEVIKASVATASGTIELLPAALSGRNSPGNVFGSGWGESIFDVTLTLAHSSSTLDLSFFTNGAGWQGGADESFGIDNLRITTDSISAVPLPAGLPLLIGGFGLLGIAGRRRKKAGRA